MAAASYLNVFGIESAPVDECIMPGDLVRTGQNKFPHFRVISVHQDMVWVRNIETGADGLARANRCRKING